MIALNILKIKSNSNTRMEQPQEQTENIKAKPTINGYIATECWNAEILIKLLWKEGLLKTTGGKIAGLDCQYENEWEQMSLILTKLAKNGVKLAFTKRGLWEMSQDLSQFNDSFKVRYSFSAGKACGRVYPAKSLGYCTVRKQIRHTFCKGEWTDIDVSNCHPNLLNQKFKKAYRVLNDYCERRPHYYELLREHFTVEGESYLTDDDACKELFIMCGLYNGAWCGWIATNGLPDIPPPEWITELATEMADIYQHLQVEYHELAQTLFDEGSKNHQGSLVSWVLQDEERKVLESLVAHFTKEKLIGRNTREVVLAYDGLQLKIGGVSKLQLNKAQLAIQEATGYELLLTTKPFDKGYTDEELDFEITEPTEATALMDAYEMLKDKMELPDDVEEATAICQTVLDEFIDCIDNPTHTRIAKSIKLLMQCRIAFVGDKTWYMFENKCWVLDKEDMPRKYISGVANQVFLQIHQAYVDNPPDVNDKEAVKEHKEKCLRIKGISGKCEDSTQKSHIYKELKEVCIDAQFKNGFNTTKMQLPLQGGLMYEFETHTTRERTVEDKFDYECPVELIEDISAGRDYFNSLFCGDTETQQVFIDVVKTAMSGTLLRYLFICSGSGSNGKSALFKILKNIFGATMDTLAKSLFVDMGKRAGSSLNTDYEKLDKVRIGFCSEIEEGDKLNEAGIKGITGGDDIDLRTLHEKNRTITPTASVFMALNVFPDFNTEPAMIARLVNFPFNAKFALDATYYEQLVLIKNSIFSYIMQCGNIINGIAHTPAMLAVKQEHQDAQLDTVRDFLADCVDVLATDSGVNINATEFYNRYVSWCHTNNNPKQMKSKSAMSRKLKSFKIYSRPSNSKIYYDNITWKAEEEGDDGDM